MDFMIERKAEKLFEKNCTRDHFRKCRRHNRLV